MFPQFDPSKMDPKLLMELTQLVQQLPPEKIMKMQTLMHNMMAGFDVRKEMEEFEKSLPPGFREKLVTLMGPQMAGQMGGQMAGQTPGYGSPHVEEAEVVEQSAETTSAEMDLREARMTILRAVADGRMPPEEAERLLFKSA